MAFCNAALHISIENVLSLGKPPQDHPSPCGIYSKPKQDNAGVKAKLLSPRDSTMAFLSSEVA